MQYQSISIFASLHHYSGVLDCQTYCPDVGRVLKFLTENLPSSGCKSVALISRNVLKVVNDCCMGT